MRDLLALVLLVVFAFGLGVLIHESKRAAMEARLSLMRAERGARLSADRARRPRTVRTYRDGVLIHEELAPPLTLPPQENRP